MQLFYFEQLTSTSDWAAQKIKDEKFSEAFAVVAGTQTQGRGRSGHEWDSQPGGLYLTICYPVDLKKLQSPGSVTLQVGEIVADYLNDRWGIAASLKWPNDVYCSGLKIAGILAESMPLLHQSEQYMLMIGIGINMVNPVEAQSGRVAISDLSPLLKKPLAADFEFKSYAKNFVDYFDRHFRVRLDGDFSTKIWLKKIRAGYRLWWDRETGGLFRVTGVKPSGELILRNAYQQKDRKILQSSHHNFLPFALSPFGIKSKKAAPTRLWLVDQGNTSTKFYSCEERTREMYPDFNLAGRIFHGELKDAWREFAEKNLAPDSNHLFLLASVNRSSRVQLLDLISKNPACLMQRVRKIPYRLRSNYPLGEIGIDRLAIMEGALAARSGSSNEKKGLLLASSGTALTVDAIDSNNHHLGGWICPGFDLQLASLHEATSALPALSLNGGDRPLGLENLLGFDTASSMRNGVFHSMDLALAGLQMKLQQQQESEFILQKAGVWPEIRETFKTCILAPDLMPLGIWSLTCG